MNKQLGNNQPNAFFAIIFFSSILAFVGPAPAQVVYENNFDQHAQFGLYTNANLDADWNSPGFEDGVTENRVSIVTGASAFGGTGSSLAYFIQLMNMAR